MIRAWEVRLVVERNEEGGRGLYRPRGWNEHSKLDIIFVTKKQYMFITLSISRVAASHHQRTILCIQMSSSPAHYYNNIAIMFLPLRTQAPILARVFKQEPRKETRKRHA